MTKLTEQERDIYSWQISIPGLGESGQERLRDSSALVSRCGGLGGPLAYSLVAAGIGKLVLAHGGKVKPSDLNRQILMTRAQVGKSRIESVSRRLKELNPDLEIYALGDNVTKENAAGLVEKVDIVFDCAPLFSERFALNRECVKQHKPMIEAAMFGMEGQVTTIFPGETPCLSCICPETPPGWKRRFPVLGAVSALAAQIAALEGIKLLAGMGPSLKGKLLYFDTSNMVFQHIPLKRRPDCPVCGL